MQPEDIDKLFREKLERHAPPPPDYLWAQLEAELQPARKRPVLWLYASAAVITLLMLAGGAWLWRGANLDPTVGSVAKVTTQPAVKTPEVISSKNSSSQATLPAAPPSTPSEAAVATAPTKQQPSDAQLNQPLRSKPRSKPAAARQLARATPAPRAASPKKLTTKPAQNTMVATLTPTKAQPERPVAEETQPKAPQQLPTVATATATPSVPTGPIEVEVRQSAATAALAATPETPRKGRLGGQVMRQVTNALRGEPVTLPRLPEDVTVTVRPPGVNHALVIQL